MPEESSTAEPIRGLATVRRELDELEPRRRLAEQAAAELPAFFAHSLDLMCVAGFDGYFKHLNPAWTTGLGWTLHALQARPFLDLVHPDDREGTQAELTKLAAGADTSCFENRYRHQDGSHRWLQWTARPAPGRQLIYASARDVTRQKRLEREILAIADREQEHLGRELHDGLCQTLAGIAALSAALSRRLAASANSDAAAAAAEITALLNAAIGEARDLARGLGPMGLQAIGLAGALDDLALTVQQRFGVACTFECEEPFPRLGHEVEAHLFRIAQEAVNNAVTHARTERIEISLRGTDGAGRLRVRDDGVGLSDVALHGDGIGLHTMASRATLIEGSLEVRRRTSGGTAVTCVFPLPATVDTRENLGHARTGR